MRSKNETKLLVLSLLFTTGLLGSGFWFVTHPSGETLDELKLPSDSQQQQFSLGDKILVTANTNPDKQAGVQALAKSDFTTAYTKFRASLQANHNDPEALIYLNNALVAKSARLKIAVSVPIGGNLNVAREILRGVAQGQDEVNHSRGINGKLLQVAIASDDNDPALAQKVATQFVQDSSILAVVGHNSSDASISAAPIYQQSGLVMISPTSFAQNLSGIGSYIFRTVPSVTMLTDSLSRYTLKTANKTNIAICVDSKAIDNQSFKDKFSKAILAAGGKINSTVCDISTPDFNPRAVISQAIRSGADGLLLAPHVDRISKALEVAQANKGRLTLFASPTLYTYQTLQTGLADVNGMVLAVPWHPTAIPGNSFGQNAEKLWGGAVNWRTAMAYDATVALATSLQQSSTRDGLQKVLHSSSFRANGATGKIEFLPSGDRNGKAILVQIQPSSTSPTGYDFVPLNPPFSGQ